MGAEQFGVSIVTAQQTATNWLIVRETSSVSTNPKNYAAVAMARITSTGGQEYTGKGQARGLREARRDGGYALNVIIRIPCK
jgi:hypothetical protein